MKLQAILNELLKEYGTPITVKTCEEWLDVKCYGTYELDFGSFEYWTMGNKLYRLSEIALDSKELEELRYATELTTV